MSYSFGLTELAAQRRCLKKNYNDRICKTSCKWGVLYGITSRKNTGYKRKQVFDIVYIEIAYTTAADTLRKFKQMPRTYYVSNII